MCFPIGNNPTSDFVLIILGLIVGVGFPLFICTMGFDTKVRKWGHAFVSGHSTESGWCLALKVSRKQRPVPIVHSKTMGVGASVMGERVRHTTLVETRESF